MRTKEDIIEEIDALKQEYQQLEDGLNEDEFEEMLNDSYGDVSICGMLYPSGRAFKEIDEIAFNCALNDYNDSRMTDIEDEIEELEGELKDLEDEENEEVNE